MFLDQITVVWVKRCPEGDVTGCDAVVALSLSPTPPFQTSSPPPNTFLFPFLDLIFVRIFLFSSIPYRLGRLPFSLQLLALSYPFAISILYEA